MGSDPVSRATVPAAVIHLTHVAQQVGPLPLGRPASLPLGQPSQPTPALLLSSSHTRTQLLNWVVATGSSVLLLHSMIMCVTRLVYYPLRHSLLQRMVPPVPGIH